MQKVKVIQEVNKLQMLFCDGSTTTPHFRTLFMFLDTTSVSSWVYVHTIQRLGLPCTYGSQRGNISGGLRFITRFLADICINRQAGQQKRIKLHSPPTSVSMADRGKLLLTHQHPFLFNRESFCPFAGPVKRQTE